MKIKLLFILNMLRPGTGPFQRAVRLSDERFDTTIVSCYDTTEALREKAEKLAPPFGPSLETKGLVGLGKTGKISCALALMRLISSERPDIIQTNHTFSAVIATVWSKLIGVPVRVHFEGTLKKAFGGFKRIVLNAVFSLSDGVICVSNAANRANSPKGSTLGKKTVRRVIYNGVDIKDLDSCRRGGVREELNIEPDNFVVGYVGDLKEVKDVPTLIRGFDGLLSACKNSTLIIVGGGPLAGELKELARSLGIIDNIIFTGPVERRDVYRYLNAFDLFVMPSKIEGLCEAIAQAMCFSLPIVSTDIAPNLEVVTDGVNGRTFPVGNDATLAGRLLELKNNAQERISMGKKSRELVKRSLDIYSIVEEYEDFYKKLLEAKR